jgi:hypothetical protein
VHVLGTRARQGSSDPPQANQQAPFRADQLLEEPVWDDEARSSNA